MEVFLLHHARLAERELALVTPRLDVEILPLVLLLLDEKGLVSALPAPQAAVMGTSDHHVTQAAHRQAPHLQGVGQTQSAGGKWCQLA